jgi:hypothetical protein
VDRRESLSRRVSTKDVPKSLGLSETLFSTLTLPIPSPPFRGAPYNSQPTHLPTYLLSSKASYIVANLTNSSLRTSSGCLRPSKYLLLPLQVITCCICQGIRSIQRRMRSCSRTFYQQLIHTSVPSWRFFGVPFFVVFFFIHPQQGSIMFRSGEFAHQPSSQR